MSGRSFTKSILPEWVNAYFERGVDPVNRRVFLDTDIEEVTVSPVIKGLYLMETSDRQEPIEMFISSYGGDVYEVLALYDIMNTIQCPIHTFGYGKIMSAAPLLLAAGETGNRWVAPHASLMHHDWRCDNFDGTGAEIQNDAKHFEFVNDRLMRLLADHSQKDYRFWKQQTKKPHDVYFTAEEAIEWGLADQIWREKD